MKITSRPFSKFTLAPGRYWCGDPCYSYPRVKWGEFCDAIRENRDAMIMELKNSEFFVCSTAYGDGCYPVSKNGTVIGNRGVDAGLLSIIPASLIEKWDSVKSFNGIRKV